MEYDLENPLLTNFNDDFSHDSISSIFLVESDHMPAKNYLNTLKARDLDISVRREAISSISLVSSLNCVFISFLLKKKKENAELGLILFSVFLQIRSLFIISCCQLPRPVLINPRNTGN